MDDQRSAATAKDDHRERQRQKVLQGNLRSTVFWLALPVLTEQLFSLCVGLYDTFLAGRISAEATSAIGLGAYIGWFVSLVLGLVSVGTTALVSRLWGQGDFENANEILNRSLLMSSLLGVMLFGVMRLFAPQVANLINMQGEANEIAVKYLQIDAISYLFMGVTITGAAALRGAGNMKVPMAILASVSVVNIVASTCYVYGFGPWSPLGVNGIVLGTVTARVCGAFLMLIVLFRGSGGLQLALNQMKLRGQGSRRVLRVGAPAAADGAIMWMGHFLFLMIIGRLGTGESGQESFESPYFAAHIIGIQIEAITYLPAVAWGIAASTLTGQSLGYQNTSRAFRAGLEAALQCCLLGVVITIAFFTQSELIYKTMHESPAVHDVGIPAFRMVALFQIPLIISIVLQSALRGAGDTRLPAILNAISTFGLRLPLAWYFGKHLGWGLFGAWIGMCGDMFGRGLFMALRYLFGRWTATRV